MLELEALTKTYPNGDTALADFALTIVPGEIVGTVGGSGCGKSTLLRLIAGLDRPTKGRVRLKRHEIDAPRPEVGMVFQEPRLMPWLTIDDNVAFGIHRLPAAGGAAKACPGDIGPRRARQVRRALAARIVRRHGSANGPRPRPGRAAFGPASVEVCAMARKTTRR